MDNLRRHIYLGNIIHDRMYLNKDEYKYFTIEALDDGLTAKLSQNASEYRIDEGGLGEFSGRHSNSIY